MGEYSERADRAMRVAKEAGAHALSHYGRRDALVIDVKGHQDFVSQADRETELVVRAGLESAFPDDAIVGEEHAPKPGTTGFTWVIDPIDGTTNFVNGIPIWCVVIAGVAQGRIQTAAIYDPVHGEAFQAHLGGGATLNGGVLALRGRAVSDGTTAIGSSTRSAPGSSARLVAEITARRGYFVRNASGALSLAYVAAGRYLGYVESHMNAWDCLAGQLLVAEAGGRIEPQNADEMIREGGRVVAAAPGAFEELTAIADTAFG